MPKDKSEIQDQYKIEGGFINEYEFNQSKGEMEEQEHQTPEGGHVEGLRGADEPNAPQNVAERIREVEQRAHEIVERRRAKASGGAASKGGAGKVSMKQQNAENMAAGKASKKSAKKSSKKSAKKSSKKSSKKAPATKGSKAGAGKKGASKSAGKKSGGSKKGAASKKSGTKKGGASKKGAAKKGASKKGGRR
jgi:hypothetical protein